MLVELLVENYAVVEQLRVRFHPGLNLLTGETGSGKSIVVGALGLLFGNRTSADVVRSGAGRARISGIFEVPETKPLAGLLERAGIAWEDGELLVEREVLPNGKSRAFAGNRPVTAGFLRELAPFLGDIHGQHDQQRLFSENVQREMLDAFAGNAALLEEAGRLFQQWQATGAELAQLETSEQERLRLADLWSFQRNEIENAAPEPGEDAALEAERNVLRNVARLEEDTNAAYAALYDSAESALVQIRRAFSSLEDACRMDPMLESVRDSLQPAQITVEEAAHELRHYLGRLEADPERLEQVETRLAELDKLKRKYGPTIDDILKFLKQVRADLETMESADERRVELGRERERLAKNFESAATRLRKRRADAARKLAGQLEAELKYLAMERTRFRIEVEPAPWSATGADRVVYLVSTNPGEEPRPLDRVASGGELSRIALALSTCAGGNRKPRRANNTVPRTMVFDEVDSGVGGGAAESVGRRLKQLADAAQVLCVTHLPQIAGFADHHYRVEKRERKGRTVATITELNRADRTREIGRMLSGRRLTQEALRHAERLIQSATS